MRARQLRNAFAAALFFASFATYADAPTKPRVQKPDEQGNPEAAPDFHECAADVLAPTLYGAQAYCRAGDKYEWETKGVHWAIVQICGGGSGGERAHGGNGTLPLTTLVGPITSKTVHVVVGKGGKGISPGSDAKTKAQPGETSSFGDFVHAPGAPEDCAGVYTCIPGGAADVKGTDSPSASGGDTGRPWRHWDGWTAPAGGGGGAGFGPGGKGGTFFEYPLCKDCNQKSPPSDIVNLPGLRGGNCAGGGGASDLFVGYYRSDGRTAAGGDGGDGRVVIIPVPDPGAIYQQVSQALNSQNQTQPTQTPASQQTAEKPAGTP